MRAVLKAPATTVSPMKLAYTISRTIPRRRVVKVAAPMAPLDFSICDMKAEN